MVKKIQERKVITDASLFCYFNIITKFIRKNLTITDSTFHSRIKTFELQPLFEKTNTEYIPLGNIETSI